MVDKTTQTKNVFIDSDTESYTNTLNTNYKTEFKPLLKYIEFTDAFKYRPPFMIDHNLNLK